MKLISIIIPTLNEANTIQACLEALQIFRELGHELILVDAGSTDATVELATGLADQVLSCSRGRARQMNHGSKKATGDFLVFLHADTFLPENAPILLQELSQSGAVWGRFDVRLSGKHPLLRIIETLMNLRSRLTGIATGDQAIFVSRECFEKIGTYPEIDLMEDIALSGKLKKLSAPYCSRSKVVTSSRRWKQQGVLRTIIKMNLLRLRYALGTSPSQLAREYE